MGKIKFGKFVTRKRVKIAVPILVLVAIGLVIFMIFRNMNAPAQGAVAQTPPSSASVKSKLTSPGEYDGQYISFSYPANYKVTPSQKSGGFLDVVSLANTNHSGKYIAVSVVRESLQNDSGYNHRKTYPEIYKQLSASANSAVFNSTQNGSEQTGFFAQSGLVAAISLTANGNVNLSQDYNVIAGSLAWKQ